MEKNYISLESFEKIIKYNAKENKFNILEFDRQNKDSTCFTHLSIFDDESRGTILEDKNKVEGLLDALINNSPKKKEILGGFSELEKGAIGSMLGMSIGDAMGSRLEFLPYIPEDKLDPKKELKNMGEKAGGHFRLEPGQWTDDTSMGLCIADSLLVNEGKLDQYDIMNRFIAWWIGGYNNAFRNNNKNNIPSRHSVGLGGNISLSFRQYIVSPVKETKAGNKNTSGNGSIMRNAAIPICFYYEIEKACKKAKEQSLTTHQGIQAKECCNILTYIVVKILNGEKLKDVLNNLKVKEILVDIDNNEIEENLSAYKSVISLIESKTDESGEDWNWRKNEIYKYNKERARKQPGYIGSYAMDNLAMSLNIVYRAKSFEEAIIKAVNLRGDADSVASVVGQIAGAAYPLESIPSDWIKSIKKWDDGQIALRGYMLSRLYSGKSSYFKKKQKEEGIKQK